MSWRKWLWLVALFVATMSSRPVLAQGQTVTVFFEGRKVSVDGIAYGDKYYYPVDKLAKVSGTRFTWNPSTRALELNGTRAKVEPLVMGNEVFLPLDSFVEASGLVATWDLGRGTLLLNRSSDKLPNKEMGLSTPADPGNIPEIENQPFDASMSGRLPAGWHYPNPMQDTAAPPLMPAPGGKPPSASLLDRKNNGSGDVYVPRSARDGAFLVTVTDVERVDNLRGYYQPKSGHRFVVVYLSQKNVSDTAQVDPGKFYLQDTSGNNYEPLDELSSHRTVIFRPYGINFGYLVYEVPETALPTRMVLTTVGQAPLSVNL